VWICAAAILLVLITIYRFRGPGIIHRNARLFFAISWILIGTVGICGLAIVCCGITGDYCILTGWDDSLNNAPAGMLLPAGAAICGWANGVRCPEKY
jgi:hypothetical protein